MVILQDSCKTNEYLARFSKTNRYLARFGQDKWLSCKILARRMVILQDSSKTNGYLAKCCEKILHEDASSCKVLQESCKILQDNDTNSAGVYT